MQALTHASLIIVSCYSAVQSTTSVHERVGCFPLHKIGYLSSFSLKRMSAPPSKNVAFIFII